MKAIRKIINWIEFPTKSKETKFKVDLGKGEEILTYSELHTRLDNLTQEEEDNLFKNVRQCTSFDSDTTRWDLSKCMNFIPAGFSNFANFSEVDDIGLPKPNMFNNCEPIEFKDKTPPFGYLKDES